MNAAPAPRAVSWLMPGLVALTTLVTFLPGLENEFLTWDDIDKFQWNVHYRGLALAQLRWMWTTTFTGLYQPVAWMTWGADYLLWGLNPFGYHLTSLLLHAIAAVAVYFLGLRLLALHPEGWAVGDGTGRVVGASLAALFFALHPLRAEPVVWVSARGDVLAGLFAVLSVLAYLRAVRDGGRGPADRGWLAGAVGLFVLSLLSKPTAVMLPAALVVLDVYPLRRLGGAAGWLGGGGVRAAWVEKLPFVVAALVVAPMAFRGKAEATTMLPSEPFDPVTSVAKALFSAAFYLRQTFLPGMLLPAYERPPWIDPSARPIVLSGIVVTAVTAVALLGRRRWPAGLAAWVCYLVLLAPTAGLVPYGSQLVSARYTYVPCLPWGMLVGGVLASSWWGWRRGRSGTPACVAVGGLIGLMILGLGGLTWKQVQVWHDSRTLWTYTLAQNPQSALAHMELGLLADRDGDRAGAAQHFRQALALWPVYGRAHLALGRVLALDGHMSEATAQLEEGLRLLPTSAEGHVVLAGVLAQQGRRPEAIQRYRKALSLQPNAAGPHYRLGILLAQEGELDEAIEHYRQAVELNPRLADARVRLGQSLEALAARGGRPPTPSKAEPE